MRVKLIAATVVLFGVLAVAAWLRYDAVRSYKAKELNEALGNRLETIKEAERIKREADDIPDDGLAEYGLKWLLPSDTAD